ncbi:MAG TPA: hypothetical protein VEY09_16840 [Pyrinomonadaceae bacterium]|nr:hypothetical protein [Pyrinomonadaceae bacterium]
MGKTIRASVLIFLLACSASAGHMQNDVTGTPPPPPSAPQEALPADHNAPDEGPEGLTGAVLSLLRSVLALL